jgi:superfamily II DNA/RNA helicase
MYKGNSRYKPKAKNTQPSKGYHSRGKQRRVEAKKLDANLFIKKASNSNAEQHISSKKFTEFSLADKLQRNILEYGYSNTTEIQERTIPHLLEGRDVIGISSTGTGKTAAFLIPLVNKVFLDRNERILIVTPTRELAMQIADELRVFLKGMDLDIALCIGGSNMERQLKNLHHNPHFVIGTPGRLKDLIERRKLNLQLFRNIILDEVDRMVDIGFIQDVKYFISLLPKKRQSLFFSATVSDKIKEILHSFVTNPVTISVDKQGTSQNIDQDIVRINGSASKIETLHNLLINEDFNKVLIFGRTKWGIEKLTKDLIARGFKAVAIHGNKTQGQRQRALEQFKQNIANILLATDVASRGLDIQNVSHVINYDAPESYDTYIHRIGRTGRAGKKGIALTFVE